MHLDKLLIGAALGLALTTALVAGAPPRPASAETLGGGATTRSTAVATVADGVAAPPADVAPSATDALARIAELSVERLQLADTVAASKWVTGAAVDDPAREDRVVADVVAQARAQGVDPVAVTRVVRGQIEASKIVQRRLIARWHAEPQTAPTTAPDLATTVRPRIDDIDSRLVAAVGLSADVLVAPGCRAQVQQVRAESGRGLDGTHRKALHEALSRLCATPTR